MRVVIATAQVPFIRGGAEIHAESLLKALRAEGHQAELVAIPFKWYPPERILDHMLACRLLDLTESAGTPIDRLIALKFPAYLIPHPHKVLWILHQHRTSYELWDHPMGDLHYSANGAQIRQAIQQADRQLIPEARAIFANSRNVARRLKKYNDIDSEPLYHPPQNADAFYCAPAEDYLLYPSRITTIKRQALVIEALARTAQPVRIRFVGAPDHQDYADECARLVERLGLRDRVEWLGQISEQEKLQTYAEALAVLYPPVDEDFGYVTLEGMLAQKPVITCTDSGGPLEFVLDGQTGVVTEPAPEALARAMDQVWGDRGRAREMGKAGRTRYDRMDITWRHVVERLLA